MHTKARIASEEASIFRLTRNKNCTLERQSYQLKEKEMKDNESSVGVGRSTSEWHDVYEVEMMAVGFRLLSARSGSILVRR